MAKLEFDLDGKTVNPLRNGDYLWAAMEYNDYWTLVQQRDHLKTLLRALRDTGRTAREDLLAGKTLPRSLFEWDIVLMACEEPPDAEIAH